MKVINHRGHGVHRALSYFSAPPPCTLPGVGVRASAGADYRAGSVTKEIFQCIVY